MRNREKVLHSNVFLAIVNKGFVESVKEGIYPVSEQVALAKEFNKPCFLFCIDLTPEEIEETKVVFKDHRVLDIFITTTKEFKGKLPQFLDVITKWSKRDFKEKIGYIR